jgi:hypothetical protein
MTTKELEEKIEVGLRSTDPLLTLREIIVSFARSGGRREQAIDVLKQLRRHADNEQMDERLLELLDFATGYCVPGLKIW